MKEMNDMGEAERQIVRGLFQNPSGGSVALLQRGRQVPGFPAGRVARQFD